MLIAQIFLPKRYFIFLLN